MAKKKLSRDQKRAQVPLDPGQRILNRQEKAGLGTHKLMRRLWW